MSLKRRIVFNTVVQFAGRFLTSLVGFLTTLILARYLGAAEYGVYAKIYTLASFFYLFVDFGLNAVYIRKYKDDLQKLGEVFLLRTLFFVISVALILLFFWLSGNHVFTPEEKLWSLLFLPTILLFGYYTTTNIIFQLKLRYDLSVLSAIVGGLAGLLLLVLLIKQGLVWGILSVVFGYAVTVVLALILATRLSEVKPSVLRQWQSRQLRILLIEALPLGVMLFLNTMYSRVDVFVVSAFQGDRAVGIYQLAYKFFEFPLAFATFFANAIFPHYVKTYSDNRAHFWRIFSKATLLLLAVAVVFSLGAYIFAPFLGLIKVDYRLSALPLRILALGYPVFFLTSALGWLIFVEKREKHLIWIYGASFLLNIAANLLLVPRFGYLASSWITVGGEVLVLVCLLLVAIRKPSLSTDTTG